MGFASVTAYVWWFNERGISFQQLRQHSQIETTTVSSYFSSSGLAYPQSLALSVLVCIELFKALSAVSLSQSVFTISPLQNPYLLLSVGVSLCIHIVLLQTPWLSNIFGLHSLSKKDWYVVLALSLPVVILEELLKWVGRTFFSNTRNSPRSVNHIKNANSVK